MVTVALSVTFSDYDNLVVQPRDNPEDLTCKPDGTERVLLLAFLIFVALTEYLL